ncbi:MAG: VanZ family protein [bacterium]|nr:VanZ family protein [bacterium]
MTKPYETHASQEKEWIKRFLPACIWGIIILTLSSIPYLETPGLKILGVDKIGHLGEYLIFSLLIFKNKNQQKPLILLLIILFTLFDELHQKFIPGREVELADLGVNFIGILTGWLIIRRRR